MAPDFEYPFRQSLRFFADSPRTTGDLRDVDVIGLHSDLKSFCAILVVIVARFVEVLIIQGITPKTIRPRRAMADVIRGIWAQYKMVLSWDRGRRWPENRVSKALSSD